MGRAWEMAGRADWKWCVSMGASGTPSIFVNNQHLQNNADFLDVKYWKNLVDMMIANQDDMAFTQN